jgi:hypothetical protein
MLLLSNAVEQPHFQPPTLHCQNSGGSNAMKQQNKLFTLEQSLTIALANPLPSPNHSPCR